MADLTRKTANLFNYNSTRYYMGKGTNNVIAHVGNGAMFYIEATPNTQYTIKVYTNDSTFVRLYLSNAPIVQDVVTTYNEISESETTTNPTVSITNTNYSYLWIQVGGAWYTEHGGSSIMLNTGSTAKPYEPYGWVHSLRKQCSATETIQSGDTIYANGQPISTYSIKGNTVQSGTPTPSAPISVQGVGNKTANLSPNNTFTNTTTDTRSYLSLAFQAYSDSGFLNQNLTNVTESKKAIVTLTAASGTTRLTVVHNGATQNIRIVPYFSAEAGKYTLVADVTGYNPTVEGGIVLSNIMILSGEYTLETIPPYEPYGYKIPILTTQGSAVNYLGSVQSTRKIKKYIFDGTEDWQLYNGNFFSRVTDEDSETNTQVICSHFSSSNTTVIYVGSGGSRLKLFSSAISGISTVNELKDWITSEYTNGTPLTIWYVLSADNVGLINEPLMNLHSVIGTKIVDCADSISNATAIPTTDGANTITVDTTVQPSEFTATWTGWHDSSVQEYDGTNWQ